MDHSAGQLTQSKRLIAIHARRSPPLGTRYRPGPTDCSVAGLAISRLTSVRAGRLGAAIRDKVAWDRESMPPEMLRALKPFCSRMRVAK